MKKKNEGVNNINDVELLNHYPTRKAALWGAS